MVLIVVSGPYHNMACMFAFQQMGVRISEAKEQHGGSWSNTPTQGNGDAADSLGARTSNVGRAVKRKKSKYCFGN